MHKTHLMERQFFLLANQMDKDMKLTTGNNDAKYKKLQEEQEKQSNNFGNTAKSGMGKQSAGSSRTRREERKKKRKEKQSGFAENPDDIQLSVVVMSEQEVQAREEIDAERELQEQHLADISAGLIETMNVAQDMNTLLTKQSHYIRELDNILEKLNEQAEEDVKRLTTINLKQEGAVNTWVPRLVCLILLVLIAGAVAYQFFV